jgi:hypothetical protein
MYMYRLAVEVWHRLLQLDRSSVQNPPIGSSIVEIPAGVDRPDGYCPLQP